MGLDLLLTHSQQLHAVQLRECVLTVCAQAVTRVGSDVCACEDSLLSARCVSTGKNAGRTADL